jgi:ketosteroid isomerase-like protein
METPDERRPDAASTEALRSLARDYASGVDRRDRTLLLSAFHPDATLTVVRHDDPSTSPRTMSGHDEIGRIVERIARYSHTFHFLGQHDYGLTDTGATGEVSCIAHHRWAADDAEHDHVMYIRYLDGYRRGEDGRWRIAARTVGVDWSETRRIDAPGRPAP